MSLYALARSALFKLDAETAHAATVALWKQFPRLSGTIMRSRAQLPTRSMGLSFRNPVGVAAGLDKNGECINALAAMGFGFVEVGTVTPQPQAGNPRPRMFRLPEHEAVINRLGFNNKGVDYLCRQVESARRSCILGINIGKNASTSNDDAADDYLTCLHKVYPLADYVTINISSPNTKNLRDLQQADALRDLLDRLMHKRDRLAVDHGRKVPVVLKLAPDLAEDSLEATCQAIAETGVDGVIATNTTISRPQVAGHKYAEEAGGLSGRPLCGLAQRRFEQLRQALPDAIPMIGVGGIHNQQSAEARFAAGANLVQVYTGFVYRGPTLIDDCVAAARKVGLG
ncbi:MAG: quinone-dependent dihydroorotate dehydrogenase [Oceanococcus sp.]